MRTLTGLSNETAQSAQIPLANGTQAGLTLYYRQNQIGWFYNLTYGNFQVNGQRLVASPNMLWSFQDILPFGLAMLVEGQQEPLGQDVFVNGTGTLVLLDQSDVILQSYTTFRGL